MIHTRSGKRLNSHQECYEAGFNDATIIFTSEREKWHNTGFNKGWMAAQKIYENELSALQQKFNTIETGQREELQAIVAWSDSQCKRESS